MGQPALTCYSCTDKGPHETAERRTDELTTDKNGRQTSNTLELR